MTIPLLTVDHIARRFGAVTALADVSFSVMPGEVVALLGDNGAGKSTLIKIIAGTQQPSSGRILWNERPVTLDDPADAKALGIETVYQDLSLAPNIDVVGNFFMGRELTRSFAGIRWLREREMEEVTRAALNRLGTRMPDVRAKVENLSGGQRQAIELCRFVHFGGKLVLLDEPFAALGVEQTRRGLDMIDRVRGEGISVIVITHNVLHALQVADRMVVIRHGQVAGERTRAATSHNELIELITGDASLTRPSSAV